MTTKLTSYKKTMIYKSWKMMKNILTIQLTSMMKTGKVWRTAEEQICCRPDRAKFEPAILLRAGLKICHTTTMTTTTTKTRLMKTTSGGNRENFAPKDYEGCKNGGARGCKNSEKNITDLFLDGDTLKSKAIEDQCWQQDQVYRSSLKCIIKEPNGHVPTEGHNQSRRP